MVPICYEEGVVGGASEGTAAAMNVATETFIKEVLTGIFGRVRSNGPSYVMTSTYKRRLEREEEAWLRVRAQRPQSEKIARADRVFDNSTTREALIAQVDAAWADLTSH